jgi:xylose isomerase
MLEDGRLQAALEERYRGWGGELGEAILAGEVDLVDLAQQVEEKGLDPAPVSGRQEWLENLVSRYL